MSRARFQILSLDGGGLKGLFTASFLAAIEKHTGVRIVDKFDLISGTSTGGIIALGIGLGYTPAEILDFYRSEGPVIFPVQTRFGAGLANIKHLFIRKYSSKPLEDALKKYFGCRRLGDSAKRLIIPAFDPLKNEVHIYKTAHHERLKVDYKVPAWQVAMATAAAPTYLPAFTNEVGIRLIDGGIWANNPSMVAVTEALGYLSQRQEGIALLSIGTTTSPIAYKPRHSFAGLLSGGIKAIEFLRHGQEVSAENQAFHILGPDRFLRVNPIMGRKYSLDRLCEELIGVGESEARVQLNKVEEMFLGHRACPFSPCRKIENEVTQND